jgi:hypothetical protein
MIVMLLIMYLFYVFIDPNMSRALNSFVREWSFLQQSSFSSLLVCCDVLSPTIKKRQNDVNN